MPTFVAARDHAGDVPVIVISGTRDDTLGLAAVREGAADHLVKGGLTPREAALAEVKTLHGILPICASCKRIRDDRGAWQQIESYVRERADAEFSHGICPECAQRLYGK